LPSANFRAFCERRLCLHRRLATLSRCVTDDFVYIWRLPTLSTFCGRRLCLHLNLAFANFVTFCDRRNTPCEPPASRQIRRPPMFCIERAPQCPHKRTRRTFALARARCETTNWHPIWGGERLLPRPRPKQIENLCVFPPPNAWYRPPAVWRHRWCTVQCSSLFDRVGLPRPLRLGRQKKGRNQHGLD